MHEGDTPNFFRHGIGMAFGWVQKRGACECVGIEAN
jgi:hypothetical protein